MGYKKDDDPYWRLLYGQFLWDSGGRMDRAEHQLMTCITIAPACPRVYSLCYILCVIFCVLYFVCHILCVVSCVIFCVLSSVCILCCILCYVVCVVLFKIVGLSNYSLPFFHSIH
jgi:hypothetical protein